MIQGEVNDAYEAVIPLTVQGPLGQRQDVQAVIDTGFTGFLTVPPALVRELGLPIEGISRGTLAGGQNVPHQLLPVVLRQHQVQQGQAGAVRPELSR